MAALPDTSQENPSLDVMLSWSTDLLLGKGSSHIDDQVSAVVQSCNYHLRSLWHIRRLTVNTLACTIVNTRLDYCNALLYGVSAKNVQQLQRIQNSLVSCAIGYVPYDWSATDSLQTLHWLPITKKDNMQQAQIAHSVHNILPNSLLALLYLYTNLHQYDHSALPIDIYCINLVIM